MTLLLQSEFCMGNKHRYGDALSNGWVDHSVFSIVTRCAIFNHTAQLWWTSYINRTFLDCELTSGEFISVKISHNLILEYLTKTEYCYFKRRLESSSDGFVMITVPILNQQLRQFCGEWGDKNLWSKVGNQKAIGKIFHLCAILNHSSFSIISYVGEYARNAARSIRKISCDWLQQQDMLLIYFCLRLRVLLISWWYHIGSLVYYSFTPCDQFKRIAYVKIHY